MYNHSEKLCFSSLIFLFLPEELLLTIYSEWLVLTEIIKLDSCICSQALRPMFLKLLKLLVEIKYSQTDVTEWLQNVDYTRHDFFKWVSARGLCLKSLKFSQKSLWKNPNDKDSEQPSILWKYPVVTNDVEVLQFHKLQSFLLSNTAVPNLIGYDKDLVTIVNACENLKVLEIIESPQFFSDSTLRKINSAILAQLTDLSIGVEQDVKYSDTAAVIGTHCRQLCELDLQIASNETAILEIMKNNPQLEDISVRLGGASVVPLLDFLTSTRDDGFFSFKEIFQFSENEIFIIN